MFDRFTEDVRTVRETDPAARTTAEVLLYPGLHALWAHRLAARVSDVGFRVLARVIAQLTRFLTGVEIHPDADVGRRVVIDHGMGVVIGETAEVGDDVVMYHGVTLGGSDPDPVKRHPTVEDGVTLGAGATVIGDITIGEGATVGAGAVVVDDVPPGVTVAGNPAEPVEDESDAATESVAEADAAREAGTATDGRATDDAAETDGQAADDATETGVTTSPADCSDPTCVSD